LCRYRTAKFLPIDLMSKQPHFIRNFANRQLKLQRRMRISEKEALALVQGEARDEDRRAKEAVAAGRKFTRFLTPTHTLTTNHIEQIQEEEELAWQVSKDQQNHEAFENLQQKLAADNGVNYFENIQRAAEVIGTKEYAREMVDFLNEDEDEGEYEGQYEPEAEEASGVVQAEGAGEEMK
jgi:hypothetical protein